MNATLPNLSALIWLLVGSFCAAQDTPQTPQASQSPPGSETLLHRAAASLAAENSFQAEFRHRVQALEHAMVGKGVYRQRRTPNGVVQFRLELRLRVGDESSSIEQASNGRFLWIRRNFPGQRNFTRLDLREIRQSGVLERVGEGPSPVMSLGGLPAMLEGLSERFDFEPPRAATIGGQPAWVLEGAWKPEHLSRLQPGFPGPSGQLEVARLAAHLPTHVVVVLSRMPAWPLFPQLIEYRRAIARADEAAEQAAPMVSMEFFNVLRGVNFPAREFEFPAVEGQGEERDETTQFIQRYRKKPVNGTP